MKERSLVAFTLLAQAAVGACWTLLALRLSGRWNGAASGGRAVLVGALLAAVAGLAASFLHLGRPSNAWRALGNLRSSWLSREILFASAFTAALAASAAFSFRAGPPGFREGFAEGLAATLGLALLWSMTMAYRLRTVPAWNVGTTNAAFFASALGLGSLSALAILAFTGAPPAPGEVSPARLVIAALLFHLVGVAATVVWLRRLSLGGRAERDAFRRVVDGRRRLLVGRFALSALALAAGLSALAGALPAWLLGAAVVLAFGAEAAGRSVFYEARVRAGL